MYKRLLFFTILTIFACLSFAQNKTENNTGINTVKSISLEEALNLAVKNNVSIKREKLLLDTAKRASEHSWNSILPSLSVSANDEVAFPDIGKNKSEASLQNNFGIEGKISFSIPSDFFASMEKTKLDYEAAGISFEQAVSEILLQVKETYFSLLLAKQNLDFEKENLENAKNQAEQNEEQYKRGTLSELEYLSSKVAYEKLRPDLKAQELEFKNAIKNFCLFLGLEDNEITLDGSLEDFTNQYQSFFDEDRIKALGESLQNGNIPSIKYINKQIEATEKNLKLTKLSVYGPNANLSYSLNPMLSTSESGRIKHSASLGLSIPLENLLSFSKGADSIKAAESAVKDLQLQLSEKSKSTDADFAHIVQSLNQKEENIDSLKAFVNLTQSNYETSKFAYSKGMTEFLSLQNASKENLEAKLNLQNEYLENLKLYISLEKLCGIQCQSKED